MKPPARGVCSLLVVCCWSVMWCADACRWLGVRPFGWLRFASPACARPPSLRWGSRRPVWVIGAHAVPCGGVAAAARGPTRSLRSLGGRRRVRGAPPAPFGAAPRPPVVFRPPSGRSSSSPLPRLGRPFRRPLWAAPFSAAVALRRWSWGPGRAAPFPPPRGSPLFPCFTSSGCSALFGRRLVLGGGCAPLPLALRLNGGNRHNQPTIIKFLIINLLSFNLIPGSFSFSFK